VVTVGPGRQWGTPGPSLRQGGAAPALRELVEGPAAAGGKYCTSSILSAFSERWVAGSGC